MLTDLAVCIADTALRTVGAEFNAMLTNFPVFYSVMGLYTDEFIFVGGGLYMEWRER